MASPDDQRMNLAVLGSYFTVPWSMPTMTFPLPSNWSSCAPPPGWPGRRTPTRLERYALRFRSANGSKILRQRLDELLLAESISVRCDGFRSPAAHALYDGGPFVLAARGSERPLQRVAIAALGEQHLLM